jgi:hypothetical protein
MITRARASTRARRSGCRIALVALLAAILFGLDHALAPFAVETNAAGALLSPGGGVPLEAFAVAMGFALTRLTLVLTVGVGAALAASETVGAAWDAVASTRRREGGRARSPSRRAHPSSTS